MNPGSKPSSVFISQVLFQASELCFIELWSAVSRQELMV